MSAINDALHRAEQSRDTSQQKVVPVPRNTPPNPVLQVLAFLAIVAALLVLGWRLTLEERRSGVVESDIHRSIERLSKRQDGIEALLRSADSNLDIRVQLEILEMKNEIQALDARFDTLAFEGRRTLADEASALRQEMKGELVVVSKRLHNLERDHSILADRIEAVRSAPADPAA